jgi:hypothetical protein
MRLIPIGHDFVAEVIGIDLRAPPDADAAAAIPPPAMPCWCSTIATP